MQEKELVESVFYKSAIALSSDIDKLSDLGFKLISKVNFKNRFDVLFDKLLPSIEDGFLIEYGSLSDFAHFLGIEQKFTLIEVLPKLNSKEPPFIIRIFLPEGYTKKGEHAKTSIIIISNKELIFELVSSFKSAVFAKNFTSDLGNYILYEKGKDFFSNLVSDFFITNPKPRFRFFKNN